MLAGLVETQRAEPVSQAALLVAAQPALVARVIVEVETALARGHPQLFHRFLAAENDLAAVGENQGQDAAAVLDIQVKVAFVENVFDLLLDLVDQVMKGAAVQGHGDSSG